MGKIYIRGISNKIRHKTIQENKHESSVCYWEYHRQISH